MRHSEGKNNLLGQIAVWPYGKFRDRIDAWAYCDDIWNEFAPVSMGSGSTNPHSARERNKRRAVLDDRMFAQDEDE